MERVTTPGSNKPAGTVRNLIHQIGRPLLSCRMIHPNWFLNPTSPFVPPRCWLRAHARNRYWVNMYMISDKTWLELRAFG